MSGSVISNNTSIKIDSYGYGNTLAAGTHVLYTAAANEYIEIFYTRITNAISFVRISYPNGATFNALDTSLGQTFTTQGTANRIIVPPLCSIVAVQGSATPAAVNIYGTKFINSP